MHLRRMILSVCATSLLALPQSKPLTFNNDNGAFARP